MTARPVQRRLVLLTLGAAGLRAAQAQPKARVGWLVLTATGPYAETTGRGYLAGLREGGFVDGQNLVLERRAPRAMHRACVRWRARWWRPVST